MTCNTENKRADLETGAKRSDRSFARNGRSDGQKEQIDASMRFHAQAGWFSDRRNDGENPSMKDSNVQYFEYVNYMETRDVLPRNGEPMLSTGTDADPVSLCQPEWNEHPV